MRIGVLGTGMVGSTLGTKLDVELGNEVRMGSRSAENEKAVQWASKKMDRGLHAELLPTRLVSKRLFSTVQWTKLQWMRFALLEEEKKLAGKILVDVSNPLDFSRGGGRVQASPCATQTLLQSRSKGSSPRQK